MTNLSVIENKISSVKKYLGITERYKAYSREEIENNIDIKGAVERYLYLTAQATIDLAEAVIAYKNLRKPSTMAESFHILEENNIISKVLTQKMIGMTGFRNAIAHDYDKINYDLVYKIIHQDIQDIKDFLDIVSKI
ncbi:MAG: DUF86 domain-containing protein [Patescibacteria group bacterium]